jgi:hypothetical protein
VRRCLNGINPYSISWLLKDDAGRPHPISGRSIGYHFLPEELRRQIARDVPLWSEFIRQLCDQYGCPYIDMVGNFPDRLDQVEAILTIP